MKSKSKMAGERKKKTNSQNLWPVTYRWTAIGTVVACSAVGSKTINVARAQSLPAASGSISKTQGSSQAQRFDIVFWTAFGRACAVRACRWHHIYAVPRFDRRHYIARHFRDVYDSRRAPASARRNECDVPFHGANRRHLRTSSPTRVCQCVGDCSRRRPLCRPGCAVQG